MNKAEYMRVYRLWTSIKQRCYNKNCPDFKSYGERGVTISEEWLIFANFYKWYIDNYYEIEGGLCIDKDLFGGKEYSSENCLLIPSKLNFQIPKSKRDVDYHTGVQSTCGKFEVKIRLHDEKSKNGYFGRYETLEEAVDVYIKCKNILFQKSVDSYEGLVPDSVFKSLKSYEYKG